MDGTELLMVTIPTPVTTDRSTYMINNNLITMTNKYGLSYNDTIKAIDDLNLVVSNDQGGRIDVWRYSK